MDRFALESYLAQGVERMVRDMIRVAARDPKTSTFILKFSAECMKASRKRERSNRHGSHIPPFLICSLTDECCLNCKGCYARANACQGTDGDQLSANEWMDVFGQAASCGISFILLAGGEPLLRRDVIFSAARRQELFFPIFTNGTVIDDEYIELFDKHRNLFPVISIEGGKDATDGRRGSGVYDTIMEKMDLLRSKKVLFGVSVTVTKENITEVYSEEFISMLKEKGCKTVFYVEYVPVDGSTDLAPDDAARVSMELHLDGLRKAHHDILFVSFPGDEHSSGGCLSAGRGFFHINSCGGAEPCPFAPYSDSNVREKSLTEIMESELFSDLRSLGMLECEHNGGCVLFEKRELIRNMMPKYFEDTNN